MLRRSVEQAGSCVVIYDTCEKKCSSVRTPGAPIPTLPPSPSPTPTPTPVPTPSSLPSPPPSPTGTSCTSPPPASSGFNCVDSQWISNSSMVVTNTSTIVYANFSIQGDLSIENNSTLSITNSAFNLSGNLLVKGGGEIVISHVGAGSTIQGNFSISKGSHASIKIGENALKVLGCMQLEGQLRVEIQASGTRLPARRSRRSPSQLTMILLIRSISFLSSARVLRAATSRRPKLSSPPANAARCSFILDD